MLIHISLPVSILKIKFQYWNVLRSNTKACLQGWPKIPNTRSQWPNVLRSNTIARLQGCPKISNTNFQWPTNMLLSFENGLVSKIYKLNWAIPLFLGGACAVPKEHWVSPQAHQLWNFTIQPIFKNTIWFRPGVFNFSAPKKHESLKKNDRLEALYVLAKDERFLFFPFITGQRGDPYNIFRKNFL